MTLSPETEHLLQQFIFLSGILLIPVAIALLVVLFKAAFLIHSTSDFVRVASNELTPLMQDLRLMVANLEQAGQSASSGIHSFGDSIHSLGPALKQGLDKARVGVAALLSNLGITNRRFKL